MIVYPDTAIHANRLPKTWRKPMPCAKCKQSKLCVSHHKGCDKALSKYNGRIRRLYRRHINCVALCDDCHKTIHAICNPLIDSAPVESRTPKWAAAMQNRLTTICDAWLAGRRFFVG